MLAMASAGLLPNVLIVSPTPDLPPFKMKPEDGGEEVLLAAAKRLGIETEAETIAPPKQKENDPMKLEILSLSAIAKIIRANWKPVNYAAEPYLQAMGTLNNISDDYGYDDGKSIVLYFLSNAGTWRGDVAREVKKELNRRVKAN
jgi:hypothetical protein